MPELKHTDRKHALLSASGASRWINCTPSPRLEEGFAESTSEFAEEGTLAHEFGDLGLNLEHKRITYEEFQKQAETLRKSKYYSSEMMTQVAKYIDFVTEQVNIAKQKTSGVVLLIEEKVDLTEFIEAGFGTCDANVVADGTLYVDDLKYGKGIKVDAEENSQLKLYGLGALMKYELAYDIHTVSLNIIQPRLDHVSTWEISAEELVKWGEEVVKPKALMAYAGEGEMCAGDWCRWCKAKARCRKLTEKNTEILKHDFADPQLLSDEELIEVFKQMPVITDWVKGVSTYLLSEALKGKKWPEHKIVEGRSIRKWTDEDKVREVLATTDYKTHEYTSIKTKGIGDITTLVGKANFEKLLGKFIIKPAGKPTLVHETDKRKALGANEQAKEDFK